MSRMILSTSQKTSLIVLSTHVSIYNYGSNCYSSLLSGLIEFLWLFYSLRGRNVDNLTSWLEVEDKLIRLNIGCFVSSSTAYFCITFMITTVIAIAPTTTPTPIVSPPDPCTINNGSCSYICTSSGSGTAVVCSCPLGEKLTTDGKLCVGECLQHCLFLPP